MADGGWLRILANHKVSKTHRMVAWQGSGKPQDSLQGKCIATEIADTRQQQFGLFVLTTEAAGEMDTHVKVNNNSEDKL